MTIRKRAKSVLFAKLYILFGLLRRSAGLNMSGLESVFLPAA